MNIDSLIDCFDLRRLRSGEHNLAHISVSGVGEINRLQTFGRNGEIRSRYIAASLDKPRKQFIA